MTVANILLSFGLALFSSCLSTAISWFFVYRTDAYKSQNSQIEKKKKELEALGDVDDDNKQNSKKKKRLEEQISSYSRSISMMSMKTMWIGPVIILIFNRVTASHFNGVIVAKLPFTPIWPIKSLAHRNIESEDPRDCANQFIYTISAILIRDIINRYFGFSSNSGFSDLMQQNMNKQMANFRP